MKNTQLPSVAALRSGFYLLFILSFYFIHKFTASPENQIKNAIILNAIPAVLLVSLASLFMAKSTACEKWMPIPKFALIKKQIGKMTVWGGMVAGFVVISGVSNAVFICFSATIFMAYTGGILCGAVFASILTAIVSILVGYNWTTLEMLFCFLPFIIGGFFLGEMCKELDRQYFPPE